MRRLLLPKQMYLMDTNAACDLRPCRTAHKIDRLKLERFSLSLSICVSLFMCLCVRLCLLVFFVSLASLSLKFQFFLSPLYLFLSLCLSVPFLYRLATVCGENGATCETDLVTAAPPKQTVGKPTA